jgi:hypothetical protein
MAHLRITAALERWLSQELLVVRGNEGSIRRCRHFRLESEGGTQLAH